MYCQELWDSCAQDNTWEISKMTFMFVDSASQNRTSEISNKCHLCICSEQNTCLSTQHLSCVSTRQMSWLSTRHMSYVSTLRYAQRSQPTQRKPQRGGGRRPPPLCGGGRRPPPLPRCTGFPNTACAKGVLIWCSLALWNVALSAHLPRLAQTCSHSLQSRILTCQPPFPGLACQ